MNPHKLKQLLNYVFYARLPAGDKVCDHIPFEWAKQVHEVLHPEEFPCAAEASDEEDWGPPPMGMPNADFYTAE